VFLSVANRQSSIKQSLLRVPVRRPLALRAQSRAFAEQGVDQLPVLQVAREDLEERLRQLPERTVLQKVAFPEIPNQLAALLLLPQEHAAMERVDVGRVLIDAESSALGAVIEKRKAAFRAVHHEDPVSAGDLH